MSDKHIFLVWFDRWGASLRVHCPYEATDTDRPCWPWDIEREDPCPLPAPQDACIYEDHVDNCDLEVLAGDIEVPLPLDHVEWDDSAMRVHLESR